MARFIAKSTNRSIAIVGIVMRSLEAGLLMTHAVRSENPTTNDLEEVRAIAGTL